MARAKKKFARRPVAKRIGDQFERFSRLLEKMHRSGVEVPNGLVAGLVKMRDTVSALPADFSLAKKSAAGEFEAGDAVTLKPELVSLYGKGSAGRGEVQDLAFRKAGRGQKAVLRVAFASGETIVAAASDFLRAA